MRSYLSVIVTPSHYTAPFIQADPIIPERCISLTPKEIVITLANAVALFATAYFYSGILVAGLFGTLGLYLTSGYYKKCHLHRLHLEDQNRQIPPPTRFREIKNIYLFNNNTGVCDESVKALDKILTAIFTNAIITPFKEGLNCHPATWDPDGMVVFPGGTPSQWDSCFKDNKKEFANWAKNGRIFCVCAGAYFISSHMEYQTPQNGPEFIRERGMTNFQFNCKGPYKQETDSDLLKCEQTGKKCHAAVIGGGRLTPLTPTDPNFTPLLRYSDDSIAAAIIRNSEGRGAVLAVSPHLELGSQDFPSSLYEQAQKHYENHNRTNHQVVIKDAFFITPQKAEEMRKLLDQSEFQRVVWLNSMLQQLVATT